MTSQYFFEKILFWLIISGFVYMREYFWPCTVDFYRKNLNKNGYFPEKHNFSLVFTDNLLGIGILCPELNNLFISF